jgi:hypothetical protein
MDDRPEQERETQSVPDETKMASPANKNVLSCVDTVTKNFQGDFILIDHWRCLDGQTPLRSDYY